MEVANGIIINGNSVLTEAISMTATASAAPAAPAATPRSFQRPIMLRLLQWPSHFSKSRAAKKGARRRRAQKETGGNLAAAARGRTR
jgi:hypothetical protein